MSKQIKLKEILNPNRPTLGNEMSVVPWRLLRIVACKNLLPGIGDSMMYRAGKEIGKNLDISTAEEFVELVSSLKIGIVEVAEKGENKIVIDVKECISCSGIEPTGEPMCFFEGGLIAGGLEKVLGKRVDVKETKCIGGFGDPACRFEATF